MALSTNPLLSQLRPSAASGNSGASTASELFKSQHLKSPQGLPLVGSGITVGVADLNAKTTSRSFQQTLSDQHRHERKLAANTRANDEVTRREPERPNHHERSVERSKTRDDSVASERPVKKSETSDGGKNTTEANNGVQADSETKTASPVAEGAEDTLPESTPAQSLDAEEAVDSMPLDEKGLLNVEASGIGGEIATDVSEEAGESTSGLLAQALTDDEELLVLDAEIQEASSVGEQAAAQAADAPNSGVASQAPGIQSVGTPVVEGALAGDLSTANEGAQRQAASPLGKDIFMNLRQGQAGTAGGDAAEALAAKTGEATKAELGELLAGTTTKDGKSGLMDLSTLAARLQPAGAKGGGALELARPVSSLRESSSITLAQFNPAGAQAQSPLASAARVQLPVNIQFGQPQWVGMVAERSAMMAAQNIQTAELQLDPPELGPLIVKVSVNQEQVSISFVSSSAQVREALDQTASRLRELLEQQGLDLVDMDVSDRGGDQAEGGDDEGDMAKGHHSGADAEAESQAEDLNGEVAGEQMLATYGVDSYA